MFASSSKLPRFGGAAGRGAAGAGAGLVSGVDAVKKCFAKTVGVFVREVDSVVGTETESDGTACIVFDRVAGVVCPR